ncbi:hypothetical protein [Flagellimonas taeanensis]|nr:hypothetical protein [Allomuricauda taeanensis]
MRIEQQGGGIETGLIIGAIKGLGHEIEVLPDGPVVKRGSKQ